MNSTRMVDPDELDDIHWEIIEVLRNGRGTPRYIAGEIDTDRQAVNNSIKQLVFGNVVERIDRGLYELNEDEVPPHPDPSHDEGE